MLEDKYLLYQPMHGMGVELVIIETMMHIARITNRTLVMPLLPVIETNIYEESLDYYFEFSDHFKWISTKEFVRLNGKEIDKLYSIMPFYREEFINDKIRDCHNVWLDLIYNNTYFKKNEFVIKDIQELNIKRQLSEAEVKELFDIPEKVIALSYVNGLIQDDIYNIKGFSKDSFKELTTMPIMPKKCFMDQVKKTIDNKYVAIHYRRANNMQLVRNVLLKKKGDLPTWEEIMQHVPNEYEYAYVAYDTDYTSCVKDNRLKFMKHFDDVQGNEGAILDMCYCILSDYFVGNYYSTYSKYIYHSRLMLGKNMKDSFMFI